VPDTPAGPRGPESRLAAFRQRMAIELVGLRPVLEEWGRRHGLRPEWIQPEKRRKVAHYDMFGPAAEALISRFRAD